MEFFKEIICFCVLLSIHIQQLYGLLLRLIVLQTCVKTEPQNCDRSHSPGPALVPAKKLVVVDDPISLAFQESIEVLYIDSLFFDKGLLGFNVN